MQFHIGKNSEADERVERLISRHLDGEITSDEQAELDRLLTTDPAARVLFESYQRNDRLAAEALRADLGIAQTRRPANTQPHHTFLWVAAGAVLTTAAVVALSFLPVFNPSPKHRVPSPPSTVANHHPSPAAGQLVDFRNMDFGPKRRQGNIHREILGIRGDDPNIIYLFQQKTESARIVPISGDF